MAPTLKRTLKISSIIVAAIVLLLVGAAAFVFGPFFMTRLPIVDGFEINGMRFLQNGIVSFAVVPVGANEVVLVDGGTDTSGEAALAELARRSLTPDAVKAIFVTHGHGDHMGAILAFPRAEVMALEAEATSIEGGTRAPAGIKVTSPLQDGQTVTIGNTQVRVFAIPGHSQGHAAYVVNGVLFLGDAAIAGRDGALQNAHWFFSEDTEQNRASLKRLHDRLVRENVDIEAIACAHSGVMTNGIVALAEFARAVP
jgi:glyoxylase-like metal-dependent hydrolase (beta-lactamase superfamily II)